MSDQFIAEIRIFGFNFAPTGWAFCDGQILPISQNTALFSLLGTTFGGNGLNTFALPDLQGRAPLGPGQGPGLSLRDLGEEGGSQSVTLINSEMPTHSHSVQAGSLSASSSLALAGGAIARSTGGSAYTSAAPTVAMSSQMVQQAGGNQPHNNMMPYLTLNYCIALQGIFPPRP